MCVILGQPWETVLGMTLDQMKAVRRADNRRAARELQHAILAEQAASSKEAFEVASKEINRLTAPYGNNR